MKTMRKAKVYTGTGLLLGEVATQAEVDQLTAGLDSRIVVWSGEEETGKAIEADTMSSVSEETGQAGGYLPAWLDPGAELFEEDWRTLYALGVNPGWPEGWQRGLMDIMKNTTKQDGRWSCGEADVLACVALLKWEGKHKRTGKPLTSRSAEIRHSLKGQLTEWLEAPVEERMFDSPFSPRQWAKCMRSKWNAYGALRSRGKRVASWVARMFEAGGEMWPEKCNDLVPMHHEM